MEPLGADTLQDFDAASHAARHLTLRLFDPIESRVGSADRPIVQKVRAEFLRLLLNRLRRAADAGFPPMRDILEQTARVDLLQSPFGGASEIDEATRQRYRDSVAGIEEKSRIRHQQSEVIEQLLKDPDAFAADSEATHFSMPALDTEGRPIDSDEEEAEEEIFEAELAGEDDSAYGEIKTPDADDEPVVERPLELDKAPAAARPVSQPASEMSALNAKRMQVGERLIRSTSSILFDLIRQHCDDDYEACIHSVELAFNKTCVERLRQAILKGEDAKVILKQLMAINPVRIRVSALGSIEQSVGMQFREAVFQLETSQTYANQLQNARKVFAKYPNALLAKDAPKTYAGAVRLLASGDGSDSGTSAKPSKMATGSNQGPPGAARHTRARSGEAAVNITNKGGVAVIKLLNSSYMSQSEIRRLEGELSAFIRQEEKPRVVINFSRVDRISSAFIGVIFALNKITRNQQGQLRLAELREPVAQVFELTGVPKLIKTHKTTAEAVSALI